MNLKQSRNQLPSRTQSKRPLVGRTTRFSGVPDDRMDSTALVVDVHVGGVGKLERKFVHPISSPNRMRMSVD